MQRKSSSHSASELQVSKQPIGWGEADGLGLGDGEVDGDGLGLGEGETDGLGDGDGVMAKLSSHTPSVVVCWTGTVLGTVLGLGLGVGAGCFN